MFFYKNGNCIVGISTKNGTMIRFSKDDYLNCLFPDSMDIKITNKCYHNCPMCHENSTVQGFHADLLNSSFIDKLHPYTQLALGGGNVLLHPQLEKFLYLCKEHKLIPSITVRQSDFEKDFEKIKQWRNQELIYGVGISLENITDSFLEKLNQIPTAVIHVIAGIVTKEQLQALKGYKVLILGYKVFGRGINYYSKEIKNNIQELKDFLPNILKGHFENLSFDNLALKQLEIKTLLPVEEWNSFYMGADGEATMYVDLVKNEFGLSSTAEKRYPINGSIEEMFKTVREGRLTNESY